MDRERCTAAAVPETVEFATKPRLAQRRIERALTAGVPVSWVLGDEVYGNDRRLRIWLEQHERPHVLAVKATEPLWALVAGQGAIQVPARDLATAEPLEGWRRLSAGAGSKGERLYDWARFRLCRLQQAPWDHWLLVRRNDRQAQRDGLLRRVRPGRHQPGGAGPDRRSALAGRGVLRSGQAGGRAGRGYEVRSWHGWYRHITLSMLALAFLAAMRVNLAGQKGAGDLAHSSQLPSACPRSAASSPAFS